jgi:Zn-finger nucleic acid-binding protein
MKCPVCKSKTLAFKLLDSQLRVLECSKCGGYWLQSYQYWLWKENYDGFKPPSVKNIGVIPTGSNVNKTCPECKKILTRYLVGHGTNISIERCGKCRGTWFDKNEWELLRGKNLHDEIHLIFSSHWQKDVREEQVNKNRDKKLQEEIGNIDFNKVDAFRGWVSTHPQKRSILAYLNIRI